jgi:hypothetical protein
MQDDDEWVVETRDNGRNLPIKKTNDPAEIVEINARPFKVTDYYIDNIIKNIRS